jgi:2-methylcitrate dehydratase PrpD
MTTDNRDRKGLTQTLAEWLHGLTYEDLPEAVINLAKNRILHSLSSAYYGRNLPSARTAIAIAKNNPGNATVWASGIKADPLYAALVNGILAANTMQEDAFLGHPSETIIPTALVVGEQEKCSGKDIVTAIACGYELSGRLGMSVTSFISVHQSFFRLLSVVATIGTAATAGKIMKLDVETLTHALGYSLSLTPATPNECWWAGTMECLLEMGWNAKTGIEAALLAKWGATASPYVIEGKHGFLKCFAGRTEGAALLTNELGKTYHMMQTFFYFYPANGTNQFIIQAARPLASHGLKVKDIIRVVEKVEQGVSLYAGVDSPGPFVNQLQAQMSMQFCAAAAILGRPVESAQYFAEHYDDPEVNELARKVEVTWEWNRMFMKPRIEVYTTDGRVLVGEEEVINLEPFTPTTEKMEKRFLAFASDYLGYERAQKIVELVRNLEEVNDLNQLTKVL